MSRYEDNQIYSLEEILAEFGSGGAKPAQNEVASPKESAPTPPPAPKTADQLFEEKLKQFMSESDSKISSIRQYSDHRTRSRRR